MNAPIKWSEAGIISALGAAFEWNRRCCCPNVQEGSEMDFALLTDSNMLWECEIKISIADWRNDLKKVRRYARGWEPARFYYAVPEALIASGIPEWVPAHAGVIALFDDDGRARPRWVRVAKILHKAKAAPEVRRAMLQKIYFRYWRHVAPVLAKTQPATIELPAESGGG